MLFSECSGAGNGRTRLSSYKYPTGKTVLWCIAAGNGHAGLSNWDSNGGTVRQIPAGVSLQAIVMLGEATLLYADDSLVCGCRQRPCWAEQLGQQQRHRPDSDQPRAIRLLQRRQLLPLWPLQPHLAPRRPRASTPGMPHSCLLSGNGLFNDAKTFSDWLKYQCCPTSFCLKLP